jgi:hypothetical protein
MLVQSQKYNGLIETLGALVHSPIMQELELNSAVLQVAAELSEDKARQGGDLGWKSRYAEIGH